MTEQHPRTVARQLVEYMRRNDDESMVLELARLTADRANGGHEAHLVACELNTALARMMLTASGPRDESDEPTYGLELTNDDDQEITIDEASPPVRAAVRALLAELNEHHGDAEFQVDLALREATFKATLEVYAHVLLWTVGMLDWCDANHMPRPRWLGPVVSRR
ncbi:hypothetical protein GCM10029964_047980 [Kibdelosporangium lantanae]